MTVPEAAGRALGALLGALVMLAAKPFARLLHDWED